MTPDGDGWAIYQIKSYTSRFRKDHVEGSFNRLKAYIADKAIQVTSWNLVMPMDPSKEARRWLTSLTGDAGFHCGWPGKIFVDGLAAEFPDVIEYYFGDGAQRLAETIQQVAAITGALRRGERATSSAPLRADDAEYGLANLHRALNKFDPHYLYDYSVTHEPPSPEHGKGFIMARTTEHDGSWVTFRVYERYQEAGNDRQATLSFVLREEVSEAEAAAYEDFLDFGTPFSTTDGLANITLDLPGGLGGVFDGGGIVLGQIDDSSGPDRPVKLQAFNPAGELVAETTLLWKPPTVGIRQPGVRTIGRDLGGCFTVESRSIVGKNGSTLNIRGADVAGKRPAQVVPGLRFLHAFRHPNAIRTAPVYGPATRDPEPIPQGAGFTDVSFVLEVAEAIQTIQEHTTTQLTMPNDDEATIAELMEVIRAAKVLRDEPVSLRVTSLEFELDGGHSDLRSGDAQTVTLINPLEVKIGMTSVSLGWFRLDTDAAYFTVTRAPDGSCRVVAASDSGAPLTLHMRRSDPPPSDHAAA